MSSVQQVVSRFGATARGQVVPISLISTAGVFIPSANVRRRITGVIASTRWHITKAGAVAPYICRCIVFEGHVDIPSLQISPSTVDDFGTICEGRAILDVTFSAPGAFVHDWHPSDQSVIIPAGASCGALVTAPCDITNLLVSDAAGAGPTGSIVLYGYDDPETMTPSAQNYRLR